MILKKDRFTNNGFGGWEFANKNLLNEFLLRLKVMFPCRKLAKLRCKVWK